MFVDELSTRDSLVRMVRRMTANLALREDLLQEALIHLWLTEARRSGQTRSWYLQSCKYHLLHYLASGRSVDSAKRRGGQLQATNDFDEWDLPEETDSGNSVLTWVSARDIIALLSPQLLPHEKAVLHCFADGLGPREIGRKLKMSHTMVIKHRRRIASLFNRLEFPRSPGSSTLPTSTALNKNGGNGHPRWSGNGTHSATTTSGVSYFTRRKKPVARVPGGIPTGLTRGHRRVGRGEFV